MDRLVAVHAAGHLPALERQTGAAGASARHSPHGREPGGWGVWTRAAGGICGGGGGGANPAAATGAISAR